MKHLRAAIRLILFSGATLGAYMIWFFGNLIVPNKQYWRQIIFRTWAKLFVTISHMQIDVVGEKPSPPFFIVSNHLSYIDIPVLRSVIESIFVANSEIKDWLIVGNAARDMGNIFINRENRRDIPRAGADVIKKLKNGEGVIIFPEGTSARGKKVLPFNSSFFEFASKSEFPIHYASITYQIENGERKPSEAICWWEDTPFITHLWRFFQVRRAKAIINFGCESIVDPNRKTLAKKLWNRVNESFIPVM